MEKAIRIGNVSSIDYEDGLISVTYPDMDDDTTDLFPVLTVGGEYKMPDIGDEVLVVHLSNGLQAGVVLGTFWNEDNLPEEFGEGLFRKELGPYPGEAYARYKDGVLELRVPSEIKLTTDHGSILLSDLLAQQ